MTRERENREDRDRVTSRTDSVALQQSAAQLLSELGREKVASYLQDRIGQVANSEKRIDLIASYALLKEGNAHCLLLQLATCVSEPNEIRAACLYWLAKTAGPRAIDPVISALSNPDQVIRIAALRSVSILPRMEAVRQLHMALEHKSADIQAVAASMLLEIEASEKVELIEQYFHHHPTSPDAERARDFTDKVKRERSRREAEEWPRDARRIYRHDSLYGDND
jgi:HEAT repeat protein